MAPSVSAEERLLARRSATVLVLAVLLVAVDVGGTVFALEAAEDFKAWRIWESFHRSMEHKLHPRYGQNTTHVKAPTDNERQQEALDASVVELSALLLFRLAGGAASLLFYWPRSFLRRGRAANGLFSVRFFCEAAFVLCTVACALKTALVVYSTWFSHHARHHNDGSASGAGSDSWGIDDTGETIEGRLDGYIFDGSASLDERQQIQGSFQRLQGIWLCVASMLATACSVCYTLLIRFVGNRNWRDPSSSPEPSWLAEQQRVFGWRFLLFIGLVNLIYGITTSWFLYFNTYYLARDLRLSPSQLSSIGGTISLCIIIRPLLGFLSDAVPICGSTRSAYFFIAAAGSSGCYLALAYLKPLVDISVGVSVALLCTANILGYAWCGVLLYAIVATEQRREPVNGAAQLNAIQWGFYSGGALLGDLSEGVVLEAVGRPHNGYWLCCGCWAAMAFCGLLYEEGRPIAPPSDVRVNSGAPATVAVSAAVSDLGATHGNIQQEQDPLAERLLHPSPGQDADNDSSVDEVRIGGLKHQMQKLWITLNPAGPTQGVVLSAVSYIFLTWAVVPDVGTGATYYFYTGSKSNGGLQFGDVTYSMLSVVGDIAMLGASYIYGAYLGATPLRKLFIGLQLLNVAASVLDLALALHWNERLGISAAAFAGLGVEASLTACIAGMNDLSGAVAQYFGAWLTTLCGVTSVDFERVWVIYLVRTACKLIPIPLVLLVPSEARLDEALRDVRRTFAKLEREANAKAQDRVAR